MTPPAADAATPKGSEALARPAATPKRRLHPDYALPLATALDLATGRWTVETAMRETARGPKPATIIGRDGAALELLAAPDAARALETHRRCVRRLLVTNGGQWADPGEPGSPGSARWRDDGEPS